ncbi:hypothetical protein FH966_12865 [Lentibacillus cibarius]|uniref:Uncharacterized protein n=1 Tax=Lentibacillus cibarius TaxID=2583219 RepID=A0A549YKU8_9BACI|nr:hypothetical protein [Lentibacillus cibarius]TMN23684.1 hypothetical protein FFL34_17435 [Lentibacillus cibarius]TRM12516.1 hypothetical protein FH966_12865 [Lentibacillus cibarius]
MHPEQTASSKKRTLRIILPELYNFITTKLEELYNIHPYDIQVYAVKEASGYKLFLYYGDGYAHQKSQSFTDEALQNFDTELLEFIESVGESCKEVMIADYYRMMKP